MDPITYSIKENGSSDNYYARIREFTHEVIREGEILSPYIREYAAFIKKYELEEPREEIEYLLELMNFGILWRSYSNIALAVKSAPFIILSKMAEWRKKHQKLKPYIDLSRGVLISLFLMKKGNDTATQPTITNIDHLCKWLEATGEFREEALRFIRWRAFWGIKGVYKLIPMFNDIRKFTDWFEVRAEEVLGRYTNNVGQFIINNERKYKWREDRISCLKTRLEYHLNMVGAELMNRAFRKEFLVSEERYVLLPGCMRRKWDECEAKRIKEGLMCTDCDPVCKVNQLRKLGVREGFDVIIIPHASDLSLWAPKEGLPLRGVIASACVTTLLGGGWELKRYGVPAQCVLLDNCGCKKHWHPTGEPTTLNIKELKRIHYN
jgi:uncharacterized protein